MTSEVTKRPWRSFLKVIFEISDLNNICCHVSPFAYISLFLHVASICSYSLWAACKEPLKIKLTFLRFKICNLNYDV